MLYLLLVIIIMLIIGLLFDEDLLAFYAGAGIVLGLFAWIFVGSFVGKYFEIEDNIEEYEICALNDTTSMSGSKYLFSGYINEEFVYRYVVKTDKGKQIKDLKNQNVYIIEGDYTPMIRIHTYDYKSEAALLFCWNPPGYENYVEFLVPYDTIATEYNINLEGEIWLN